MAEIIRYVVVDENDQWVGTDFERFDEAKSEAEGYTEPHAVLEVTYVYDDSELVWAPVWASNGADVWPAPEEAA